MIGRAMEQWDDAALRRVVDAPVEEWDTGGNGAMGPDVPPACLYEHAFGNAYEVAHGFTGAFRFDALCDRFGMPRVVRAVKKRALAILLRRHPLSTTHSPHESAVTDPATTEVVK